eukprot:TRINITY_DN9344_c0_g1_i4.p1 TRINITY_DN9344_c0_g1~~TRINITY_DN9344_c0_g1_i4.p1  ORF type:complete len:322 (-),score=66.92 TRINITY_DN9344_c0_g1_i4:111-1076(-)
MGAACGHPAVGGSSDSDGRPSVAAYGSTFSINVQNVSGDGFQLEVRGDLRGWDLMAMLGQRHASETPGVWNVVVDGSLIDPSKTLGELNLGDGADVTEVFEAATADDVQRIIRTYSNGEAHTMTNKDLSIFSSLRDLHMSGCGRRLRQSMQKVALPSGLQSLTFDDDFDQSMEKVVLPSGLQSLTFGMCFNQSMEKVDLPSGLQSLTFGLRYGRFNQSMEKVALPSGLQSLTFGDDFDQSMEKVTLPSGLQSLTFGRRFNQIMEKVALPSGLQSLTFGKRFNQSMEKVDLPSGLQSLTFGGAFNQSMEKVTLPPGLQVNYN